MFDELINQYLNLLFYYVILCIIFTVIGVSFKSSYLLSIVLLMKVTKSKCSDNNNYSVHKINVIKVLNDGYYIILYISDDEWIYCTSCRDYTMWL